MVTKISLLRFYLIFKTSPVLGLHSFALYVVKYGFTCSMENWFHNLNYKLQMKPIANLIYSL